MTLNYEPSADPPRPWFLNPAFVFYSTWLTVYFLYTLRLSDLLIFSNSTLFSLELPLLGAFLPMFLLTKFLPNRLYLRAPQVTGEEALEILDRRLRFWFAFWIALTIVEIIYSGGIPIIWSLNHSTKTYFDFGIPTLHGLLNGLILAISLTRFAIGIKFHRRRDLFFPLFTAFWSFVVVTRQGIIIMTLEAALIFMMYRQIKLKRVLILCLVALLSIIIFGIAGDIRSGAANFLDVSAASGRFPSWLPSGFLWVYMYMTTPINNALNTLLHVSPLNDITLSNTLSSLVPTAVRKVTAGNGFQLDTGGDLISNAFNVSTAYVGPIQDWGLWGVIGFSNFVAFVTGVFWRRTGMRDNLTFAVLMENLSLTIFFDHFLYLPVVSQIFWVYVFFRGMGGDISFSLPESHSGLVVDHHFVPEGFQGSKI